MNSAAFPANVVTTPATLHTLFKDAGRSPYFIVPSLVLNSLIIPGMVMNLFLVYVTIRYR